MNSIALLVLLDAFRPDYLERTTFLRALARRGGVGSMEEPFGFVPRAAYFGGLTPNDTGYSNIFARESWRSPFPCVPGLRRVLSLGDPPTIRRRVETEALMRVPDFGARYAEGFALPVEALSSYAITEIEPPWGPCCGYRSLFHILDDAKLKWIQCSWPYTREIRSADPGIVGAFLEQLTPETRFGFVHLSQLDAIGHVHGPGSVELQRALEEIDDACAAMYEAAHERFDRVRILFFGDHGMVSVVRSVDLLQPLREAGIVADDEVDVFLDSPMARFWFRSDAARARTVLVLSRLDCGRVLTPDVLARFDADRMQRGNGELFFVAHPGIVFAPNAFQGEAIAVRGMHGYLPDVPDNQGLLLTYDSRDRTAGTLGVARATQLFPTCLEMCDLDAAAFTALPALRVMPRPRTWTRGGLAAHESYVDADIASAKATLAAHAPASAVIVVGSFGRGEGAVVTSGNEPRVLNDYDFVVVGPDAVETASLGRPLARQLRTDFCDVLAFNTPSSLLPSQLSFDVRYGGRVVAGDARALDRMARFAPADIPVRDAALLLLNRVAGVMLVPLPEQQQAKPGQFAVNQVAKALAAAGDAVLIAIGDYSTSSATRARRFRALAPAVDVPGEIADRIERAYGYRLDPVEAPGPFGAEDFRAVRDSCACAMRFVAARLGECGESFLTDGWAHAIRAAVAPVADPEADDADAVRKLGEAGFASARDGRTVLGVRRVIFEGLVALFFATDRASPREDLLALARGRVCQLGARGERADETGSKTSRADDAEWTRQQLAAAWSVVCH